MESQNDVLSGHTGRDQPVGDPLLRTIVLDPDLALLDIHVDDTAVDPMLAVPADGHQLIMPGLGEEDLLDLDIAIRGLVRAVLPEDLLD
jgi:hypothetical protein